jgi:hypothetical protein
MTSAGITRPPYLYSEVSIKKANVSHFHDSSVIFGGTGGAVDPEVGGKEVKEVIYTIVLNTGSWNSKVILQNKNTRVPCHISNNSITYYNPSLLSKFEDWGTFYFEVIVTIPKRTPANLLQEVKVELFRSIVYINSTTRGPVRLDWILFKIFTRPYYLFALKPISPLNISIVKGIRTTLILNLTNLANCEDSFNFSIRNRDKFEAAGLKFKLPQGVTIGSEKSKLVEIEVEASENAVPGLYSVILEVESQGAKNKCNETVSDYVMLFISIEENWRYIIGIGVGISAVVICIAVAIDIIARKRRKGR